MIPFFQALATFFLAVHLFLAGIGSGIPLLLALLIWRKNATNRQLLRKQIDKLAMDSIGLLLLAGLLGLVYGALVWDSDLWQSIQTAQSRIIFGVIEYFFSLSLITVFAVWFRKKPQTEKWGRIFQGLLLFVAATNLLYHFPLLFLVLRDVRELADIDGSISSAGFRTLIFQSKTMLGWIHFCAAALIGALLYSAWRLNVREDTENNRELTEHTRPLALKYLRWCFLLVCLQWPLGIIVFSWMPRQKITSLLSIQESWSWFFIQALVFVGVLNWMLAKLLVRPNRQLTSWTLALLFVIYVMMTAFRRYGG